MEITFWDSSTSNMMLTIMEQVHPFSGQGITYYGQ